MPEPRWPAHWKPLDHDPLSLSRARRRRDWSQRRLASEIGVAPSFISELESGGRNANPALIRRLARALRCSEDSIEHRRKPKWQNPSADESAA